MIQPSGSGTRAGAGGLCPAAVSPIAPHAVTQSPVQRSVSVMVRPALKSPHGVDRALHDCFVSMKVSRKVLS